jgi:3-hydroxyacyl-[acyl-carrier-protein] dehydratase
MGDEGAFKRLPNMNRMRAEIQASAKGQVERPDAHTVKKLYQFKESFVGFVGHFPADPILPAFVQILTALSLVAEGFSGGYELGGVMRAKFHLPIRPNDEIQVECHDLTEGQLGRCRVQLMVADRVASAFDLMPSRYGSTG